MFKNALFALALLGSTLGLADEAFKDVTDSSTALWFANALISPPVLEALAKELPRAHKRSLVNLRYRKNQKQIPAEGGKNQSLDVYEFQATIMAKDGDDAALADDTRRIKLTVEGHAPAYESALPQVSITKRY